MEKHVPEIVENYVEFTPPPRVLVNIKRALRLVPSGDTVGLASVILTNTAALPREVRRTRSRRLGYKVRLDEALGYYCRATNRGPANVTILVDRILEAHSNPVMRQYKLVFVLYHEIGHHVQTIRRDPRRQRENFADAYADKKVSKFMRSPRTLSRFAWLVMLATVRHPVKSLRILYRFVQQGKGLVGLLFRKKA